MRVQTICDDALKRDPKDWFALMVLADMHWRNEKRQLALPFALRILDNSPNDFDALRIVVDAYIERGENEPAYGYAKRLCAADTPAPVPTRIGFGLFYPLMWIPKIRRARDSLVGGMQQKESLNSEWVQWAREYVHWYESQSPMA